MFYLDTSVVVAYYVPEALSAQVQAKFGSFTAPAISHLVQLELFAAVSARVRAGNLKRMHAEQVVQQFQHHIEGGWYTSLPLSPAHYRWARDFLSHFDLPLKAPDSLHLAVAAAEGLSLLTADQQLARNAQALGVPVELIAA